MKGGFNGHADQSVRSHAEPGGELGRLRCGHPSATAIDLAQEYVSLVEAMLKIATSNSCLVHVSPTRNGGVLIEWEDQARQHEVEVNPDRSIGFLHLDKSTGQIETRKFSAGALHRGLLQ